MSEYHTSVLLKEAIQFLNVKPNKSYIDATVGGGGHAEAITKLKGKLLGLDIDPDALKAAKEHLTSACPTAFWRLAQGNFVNIHKVALEKGFIPVSGILFDLGVSNYQFKTPERGFSFQDDTPLDMRMNPELKVTAADLINGLNEGELAELFWKLGDEKQAKRIAKEIIQARQRNAIKTGIQLADIVSSIYKSNSKLVKIHPATKVFQALRIAVNDELNNLRSALPQTLEILESKGRIVIISFHSGEDRIVKEFFKKTETEGLIKILTKKPIRPSLEEIKINPKSRSAMLRAVEKI